MNKNMKNSKFSHLEVYKKFKEKIKLHKKFIDDFSMLISNNPIVCLTKNKTHILNTVFEIAAAHKIQLVCLTAHRQESILLRFPVAYSLQLRSVMGKEVMQHDRLESGFYNVSGREE